MIKNIIFDLGNVLFNIDENKTYDGLKEILDPALCENIYEEVFIPYELGEISEEAFFNRLQRRSKKVLQGDVYMEIWNLMLLDFPKHRIEFLERLRKQYKLILLSNNNITHLRNVLRIMKTSLGVSNLNDYFDHIYFSHDLHLRKPDIAIYKFVLEEAKILAEESLFIDDNLENYTAALTLGIHGHLHHPKEEISTIFEEIIKKIHV